MLQSQNSMIVNVEFYNNNIIKNKAYSHNNRTYNILNYDRAYVCNNDYENSKYRSLVISFPEKKLLCFSCPKSITFDSFITKYPVLDSEILVNDIIEGTMINLFYDDRIQNWQIATKSAVGGNYWYFRNQYDNTEKTQKTFNEMFLEALG